MSGCWTISSATCRFWKSALPRHRLRAQPDDIDPHPQLAYGLVEIDTIVRHQMARRCMELLKATSTFAWSAPTATQHSDCRSKRRHCRPQGSLQVVDLYYWYRLTGGSDDHDRQALSQRPQPGCPAAA